MVLFSHLGVMFYPAYYWTGIQQHSRFIEHFFGQTPLSFVLSGNSGVMIFLMITGFGSYMVCNKGKESCVKYASLRFFKLSVLMFISTITIWMLFRLNLVYYSDIVEKTYTIWIQGNFPYNNIFSLFFGNWFQISTAYNNTLWTMQYIFGGSVICVLVYSLWGDCDREYIVLLISGLIFMIMGMPSYLACILGYALAHHFKNNSMKRINVWLGIGFLLTAFILCGFPMEIESQFFIYRFLPRRYVEYYHVVGAFLLVYGCLFCNSFRKVAESRFFLMLGKYSMSIYVIHFAVLISITSFLFTKLINRFSYNMTVMIVWIATVFIVFAIALLLKPVIDKVYNVMDRIYDAVLCQGMRKH